MNTLEKAKILTKASQHDSCGPKMCEVNINPGLGGVYHAKAEHKSCRIFKTLMDNSCSHDCAYCANSTHTTGQKAAYEPKELVTLFSHLHNKLDVNGLFLSSGLSGDPDKVAEKMTETVRMLREEKYFNGYIHLKVLPGTSRDTIKHAASFVDRMSINIEAPSGGVLDEMSSCKEYSTDLLRRQAWISKLKLRDGQTTQMIINDRATDKDVLKRTRSEYEDLDLRRVYYSAFSPVKGTPFEDEPKTPARRQNRLYNTDFLFREYNYKMKEFDAIMDEGMLPDGDPKLELAKMTFDRPIDVNEADYEELIRIPGIGPKTARQISLGVVKIKHRRDLRALGGWTKRAEPFIKINGRRQSRLVDFN